MVYSSYNIIEIHFHTPISIRKENSDGLITMIEEKRITIMKSGWDEASSNAIQF